MTAALGHEPSLVERWYRLAVHAYPSAHRSEHGAEIVGALMEAAPSGRRLPSPRETAALVGSGLAVRARRAAEGPAPWWADGLHLGVLILAVANLAYAFADHTTPAWTAVSAALVLTLMRGWTRVALPLALFVTFSTGRAMVFGAFWTGGSLFGPTYGNWVSLTPYWILAAGTAVLAVRGSRDLRARSWWWAAIPVLAFALTAGGLAYGAPWQGMRAAVEGALLLAGIGATITTRSPRWALAAAIHIVPGGLNTVLHLPMSSRQDSAYRLILAALLIAMAALSRRDGKQALA